MVKSTVINVLHDDYDNTATIEMAYIHPYKGANNLAPAYILSLTSNCDDGFMYYRGTFESMDELMDKLHTISCDTWH